MKDIIGYEGKYAITEDGQVWSYLSNKFLKPFNKNGYLRVELSGTPYLIHRLVALAYIDNPDNKPTVDHIDHNRHNNCVSNLRWVTATENNSNLNQHYNHGFIQLKPVYMCDKTTHVKIRLFDSAVEASQFWEKNPSNLIFVRYALAKEKVLVDIIGNMPNKKRQQESS